MCGGTDPGGYGSRKTFGISSQRSIKRTVVSGLIADAVHHHGVGAPSIMQVGQAIRQSWPAMQQRYRRFAHDPRVPVGRTGHDSLGQT